MREMGKGGDNVVSLIWKHLCTKNILNDWKESNVLPGRKLTLCFDNCDGQNKNKMVMKFACYIVERGIYQAV